jgi:hypothetical protein
LSRSTALSPACAHAAHPVRFRRFTSLNTTIRLREGQIHVSLSDLLEGAPESVLRAIAHILLAKLYKKPIDPRTTMRYKRFASSAAVTRQTELIRHARGTKRFTAPRAASTTWKRSSTSLNALLRRPARPAGAHLERAPRQAPRWATTTRPTTPSS